MGSVSAAVGEQAFLHAHQEHHRVLQPLGAVQRHQHDLVVVVELVGVGHQRHLLEELVGAGELACRADHLADVLQPAGRLHRAFHLGFQLGQVPAAVHDGLQQVAGAVGLVGGQQADLVEQAHEALHPAPLGR